MIKKLFIPLKSVTSENFALFVTGFKKAKLPAKYGPYIKD